jgi:hypothetical protein
LRRVTLTVAGLALLVSLGIGFLVGRMAGGGSDADRDHVVPAVTASTPTIVTSRSSNSPVPSPATPMAEEIRRPETPFGPSV